MLRATNRALFFALWQHRHGIDFKMRLPESFRTGIVRSLIALYPDTRREHHPAAPHGANFPLVSVPGVFHALHRVSLERVSFLKQLVHTLRIRTFNVGQSLQISRLLRPRSQPLQFERHRLHALAFPPNLFLRSPAVFPPVVFLPPAFVLTSSFFGAAFFFAKFFLGVTLGLASFFLTAFFIGATFLPAVLFDFVCFFLVFFLVAIRAV